MGMIINFKCDVQTMQLNTWEKDEYPGAGWIKFYGEDGSTWGEEKDGTPANAKGSSVKGYYNTDTHQINFYCGLQHDERSLGVFPANNRQDAHQQL